MSCSDCSPGDPNRLEYYSRKIWADPAVTMGQFNAAGTGGFATGTEKTLTFTAGYIPVETRISAFEFCFADPSIIAGTLVQPITKKIQLALFTASPINRMPLNYMAGSETDPTLTFNDANSNYGNIQGGGGYRIPMNPTLLLPGWYSLAVLIELVTTPGHILCNNPTFEPAITPISASTWVFGNLDWTGLTPGPAVGALAGLNVNVSTFAVASLNKQANIAWMAVSDALGGM